MTDEVDVEPEPLPAAARPSHLHPATHRSAPHTAAIMNFTSSSPTSTLLSPAPCSRSQPTPAGLRKNEETRLDDFEMKGLRRILRVSWTAKKTNEWVLNKAGVKKELLDTVKARKLAYNGHTMRKRGSCLEKEIIQGTMLGARRRGRPRTASMDNIKTWTGLSVEESIRMTEDRDKWRKHVHSVANTRIEDG